ncbi:MAG: hypothetical protein JRH20_03530, partial [Deltaproteobacteria bacterium]|nr:hypothetical protein [Deltaproteobacteria bacterium]
SDPTLGPALAEDLEHALESADAAVSHLMSRASRAPQDATQRQRRAAWLAMASRLDRCATAVQLSCGVLAAR